MDEVQDYIWVKVIERSDWKTHGFDRPIVRVSGMRKGSDYFRRSSVVCAPVLDEEFGSQSRVYLVEGAEEGNYYWSLSGECRWRETVIRFSDSGINWLFVVCEFIEKNDGKKGELAWHHGV